MNEIKPVHGAQAAEPGLADKAACIQDRIQDGAAEMQSHHEQLIDLQPSHAKAVSVSDPTTSRGAKIPAGPAGIPAAEHSSYSQTGQGVGCKMDSREAGSGDAIVPEAQPEQPASVPEGLVTELRFQLAKREADLENVEGVLMQAHAALQQAQTVPLL